MPAKYWSTFVSPHSPLLRLARLGDDSSPPAVPPLSNFSCPVSKPVFLVSSDHPAEVYPFTLHAQHRRFGDPRDLELYLSFREPQRVRYTTTDGILHDEYIEVNYEFTTVDCSAQFQGDIRCQELVDWFDVDVVWSDSHRRTDSYGNVRGLGTIQRLKLWRDRNSATHFLTFFANHRRRWKDFVVGDFEREFRQRDDRHRRLQLDTRGTRRGSASESVHSQGRRFSASSIFRRSSTSGSYAPASSSASQSATNIRYLGIQFTRNDQMQPGTDGMLEGPPTAGCKKALTTKDYHRFIDAWGLAQDADDQYGARLPSHAVELESPHINGLVEAPYMNGVVAELPSPELNELPTVAESSGSAYTYSTYPDGGAYWSSQAS